MQKWFIVFILLFSLKSLSQETIFSDVSLTRLSTFEVTNGPHVAFPSMVLLPNDTIMMIYRKGASHVEPSGRIMRVFGTKNGSWWGASQTIIDTPGIDDRDPSITILNDGRIMISYYTYIAGSSMSIPATPAITSIFVCFSSDNGQTFTTPQSIDGNNFTTVPIGTAFSGNYFTLPNGNIFQTFATSSPAVEAHDRIIIPAYGGNALVWSSTPGLTVSEPNKLFFFESINGGITWQRHAVADNFLPDSWKAEPTICPLENGNYLMHYRCADGLNNPMSPGPMRQAILNPSLNVFTPDLDFNFVGHAPDILRLSNGILISAFRHVNPTPMSQDICFVYSNDDGYSWSDTIRVAQGTTESAYPTMIEISPNKFLIAYYLSGGTKIKATVYHLNIKEDVLASNFLPENNEEYALNIQEEDIRFTFYPNPAKEFLTVQLTDEWRENVQFEIINNQGSILFSELFPYISSDEQRISLSGIPSGIYYIRIVKENNYLIEKLIIE